MKCKSCKKEFDKEDEKLVKDLCKQCLNKPKPKIYFDVKVETLLPATLIYRVLAESPEQAADMIKNIAPNSVNYRLLGKKDLRMMIYLAGQSIIKLIKSLH